MMLNARFNTTGNNAYSHGGIPMIPARMDVKLTADILGFQEHDIPVLVSHGELEPLGKPMPNAKKYFARVDVLTVADDRAWLSKATKLIYQHWQEKNANRGKADDSGQGDSSKN